MRTAGLASIALLGCASTVDGTRRTDLDSAVAADVPPGRNPDGFDPFRPADVPLQVDASADVDPWDLRDASVFDQRLASFSLGLLSGGASVTSYFSASFRYFPRPDDPRCSYVAVGSWSVQRCRQDMSSARDTHPTPFPNAGEIRAVGGTRDLILRPGSTGTYSAQATDDPVIRDGAVLTIRTAGNATVPAFTLMAPVPPALTVTSPSLRGEVNVSRGSDLVVTWVPIAARLVNVTLQFVTDGPPRTSVRVDVQAQGDEGRAVLPARALRDIAPEEGELMGSITVQPTNFTVGRAGAWPLQVTSFGRGVSTTVRLR